MSARIGRNQRFDAAGNAPTAAGLGVIAQFLSKTTIFFGVALLAVPWGVALDPSARDWLRPSSQSQRS
jgi:hypothetical protein